MKYLLHIIILQAFFISYSCESDCNSPGYHQKMDSTKIITFLSRDGVSSSGTRAIAIDNLLIDKSIAPLLSIHEYSTIARQYMDTVHCDRLVGGVAFYGVTPCDVEISPRSLNMQDYELITFFFDHDKNTKQSEMANSRLSCITFSKNNDDKMFYDDGMIINNGQITTNPRNEKLGRKILDSLENLRIPLKKVQKDMF